MRNPLRKDPGNLERRLRDERPAASDDLIRRVSGSTPLPRRSRQRFGLAVALTSIVVIAFALTGGIGYAASSASKGTQAVKQLVTGSSQANTAARNSGNSQGSNQTSSEDDDPGEADESLQSQSSQRGSGKHQYQEKVTLCHKPNKKHGGITIRVSSRAVPAHLRHGDYLGPCRR